MLVRGYTFECLTKHVLRYICRCLQWSDICNDNVVACCESSQIMIYYFCGREHGVICLAASDFSLISEPNSFMTTPTHDCIMPRGNYSTHPMAHTKVTTTNLLISRPEIQWFTPKKQVKSRKAITRTLLLRKQANFVHKFPPLHRFFQGFRGQLDACGMR